ncbi:MAG: sulfatase [Verrucomicrobiae bacterium]|nr:sulfatase [Verrucomicrobiae bacterium]NNJ86460.1 sulfatase [Akkermansiaceae bacterium]
MKKNDLTKFIILAVITCSPLLLGQPCQAAAGQRDHVLLIAVDDLNDWIGCLSDPAKPGQKITRVTGKGHPQAHTPNMDRLARRGVLFTNAHCQAPICRPSRTSFMSGLRPTTTGIYGNRPQYDAKGPLQPGKQVPWMTKRFERAGYDVFTAGKILHASRNRPLGGTPCFKTGQGPYPPHKIDVPKEVTPNSIWDIGAYPEKEEDYTDLRIAKWTVGNIRKPLKQGDHPRFMALGFYNPHLPLFAPKKWFDAAPSKKDVVLGAMRDDDFDDLPEISKRISSRVSYIQCEKWVLGDEANLRTLTQAYLACTTAMDDALGHVIDALDDSDMADNIWIVVFSDHGWHLGEKNHIAKQTLWTRSTRVPLIVVPPKRLQSMPRGVRCERPAELLDIYPTLVAATGLAAVATDQQLDGISLLPWLKEPAAPKKRPALTTIYAHNHSLCSTRYRYTRYADGSEELYDRQIDPHEFDNLIDQARTREDLKSVVKELAAWIPKKEHRGPDLVDDRIKPKNR